MAIEPRRGCGYRKVGGLYLMGSGSGVPCDRLPLALTVCPCCSAGFKQSRGWTWIDVAALIGSKLPHQDCTDSGLCPLCADPAGMGKAGLLWIGEKFYAMPLDFMREANELGISRRISAVPRDFKLGITWVLLAHPKACICPTCKGSGLLEIPAGSAQLSTCEVSENSSPSCGGTGRMPGIFRVFRPHAIEKIVTESQAKDTEAMDSLTKRGITPFVVPDDDRDHQGSVYDNDDQLALVAVGAE